MIYCNASKVWDCVERRKRILLLSIKYLWAVHSRDFERFIESQSSKQSHRTDIHLMIESDEESRESSFSLNSEYKDDKFARSQTYSLTRACQIDVITSLLHSWWLLLISQRSFSIVCKSFRENNAWQKVTAVDKWLENIL